MRHCHLYHGDGNPPIFSCGWLMCGYDGQSGYVGESGTRKDNCVDHQKRIHYTAECQDKEAEERAKWLLSNPKLPEGTRIIPEGTVIDCGSKLNPLVDLEGPQQQQPAHPQQPAQPVQPVQPRGTKRKAKDNHSESGNERLLAQLNGAIADKQAAEAKYAASQQENARMKQQIENLQQQLNALSQEKAEGRFGSDVQTGDVNANQ